MLTIETVGANAKYNIKGCDLQDGKIYESEIGTIFIGNRLTFDDGRRYTAFSIDGCSIVHSDTEMMYREVDAKITVYL